jgi:hypothetical protein
MIRSECHILLEDTKEVKLEMIQKYIEEHVLPDKDRVMTRVGNFGEVLAANLLVEFEGFWFPIYKLRFREKRNWSVRLTDICLIKTDSLPRPLICYGEAKTKTVGYNLQIAVEGHNSLGKDDALDNPEILRFICTWLYETGMLQEAEFFSKLRLGKLAYDTRHDLFLVHSKETWTDRVLERLHALDIDPRLVDFSVKVLLIENLGVVIDKAYERCSMSAEELVNG